VVTIAKNNVRPTLGKNILNITIVQPVTAIIINKIKIGRTINIEENGFENSSKKTAVRDVSIEKISSLRIILLSKKKENCIKIDPAFRGSPDDKSAQKLLFK